MTMSKLRSLRRLLQGSGSLASGMGVTIRHMLRKPVTLRYPHEKPVLSKAYRSAIKLIRFEETGTHDCVACLACENICPSFCISIQGEKFEGVKKKRATGFTMDFALCSLCGLCIDVCPTTTLEYSRLYDEAGYTRDWKMDLLAEFREGEEAYLEKARAEEEARKKAKEGAKKEKSPKDAAATAPSPAAEPAPLATTAEPAGGSPA